MIRISILDKMDSQYYLFTGFIASSLAVLLLLVYTKKWKQSKGKEPRETQRGTSLKSSQEGAPCRSGINGSTDVIIVGAGVAGSALAYALAKDGWQVHIIERDLSEIDRIAGEFLLPGGYLKLVELGLEDCVEGIDAQDSSGLTFSKDGKEIPVPFPVKGFHSRLAGKGIHNGRFIQRLREKAASFPNVRLEQGSVTSLLEEKGTIKGVQFKNKDGQELTARAPLTIVCDGGFSNLRRSLSNPQVESPSSFVGFVMENIDLPCGNHVLMILTGDSPVLFYRIGSNEVRCLVDVAGPKIPSISDGEMVHYLKTVVAPLVPTELMDAFISSIDKGKIRVMTNKSMPVSSYPTPGAFLMGDAFNMRHPLTGGGMTVALSDVIVLRDLLRPLHDLRDAASICKYLESFHTIRKPIASVINILAAALHKIFASSDPLRKELGQAAFEYVGLGGVFSSGFVALLAGLNPRPLSLVFHLVALLLYGMGRILLPLPSPKRIWIGSRLLLDASGMILPTLKAEGFRQMFLPFTVPAYHRAPPVN